jgi:hypothetical protein
MQKKLASFFILITFGSTKFYKMKKIITPLAFFSLLVFCSINAFAQLYTISSVSPTSAHQGDVVTLTITAAATVTFSTSGTGCSCPTCVQVTTGSFSGLSIFMGTNTIPSASISSVNANTCVCSFTIPSTQAIGAYTVSLTGLNNCAGVKANAFTISAPTTGIQSLDDASKYFNIFPNPSKGIFDVQLTNFTATNYADVFDLLGRKVETFSLTSEKTQIDASRFGKGVYFISIRNENGIVGRQKLVIE